MTFLQQLHLHKGSLIKLKTELYWYNGGGYDNTPGRICLILDAAAVANVQEHARTAAAYAYYADAAADAAYAALLLVDGSPQWVWIAEADVEIMLEDPSTHTHACMQEVSNEQKRQHSLGSSSAGAD
jgi:hypothetical protein